MSHCLVMDTFLQDFRYENEGLSNEAIKLKNSFQELYRETVSDTNVYHMTSGQLDQVAAECSEFGWDGYDAQPIKKVVINMAEKFLIGLPKSIPTPDIIPESSGELSFEWYVRASHQVVTTITEDEEIVYSGFFGKRRTKGVEFLDNGIPEQIIRVIKRLYK